MNILIIGGTSFTGPHLVRSLAAAGHHVRVFHRGEHAMALPPNVKKINADLDSLTFYQKVLRTLKFDVVIHMIACNGHQARAAVEAFSGYVGVVVLSSLDVYKAFAAFIGKEEAVPSSRPLTESSPLRTSLNLYDDDREKLEVEEAFAVESERLPATILRLPGMYGPLDPRHRFFPTVKRFDDQRPAILLEPSYGNLRMTHAYVENVAHAIFLAATTPHAADTPLRTYNVGELQTPTVGERLHDLARAGGYKGKIIVVPRDQCPHHLIEPIDPRHDLVLDDTAIRRELGYAEIIPRDEAYRRTLAWQRTECPLAVDLDEFDYAAEDRFLKERQI